MEYTWYFKVMGIIYDVKVLKVVYVLPCFDDWFGKGWGRE